MPERVRHTSRWKIKDVIQHMPGRHRSYFVQSSQYQSAKTIMKAYCAQELRRTVSWREQSALGGTKKLAPSIAHLNNNSLILRQCSTRNSFQPYIHLTIPITGKLEDLKLAPPSIDGPQRQPRR